MSSIENNRSAVMENRLDTLSYGGQIHSTAMPVDGPTLLASLGHQQPPPRSRATAARTRAAPLSNGVASGSQPKRARKDRGPNWLAQEITALIAVKREMFLEELDTVDGRDLMTPETTKWHRVSQEVMRAGFSPCLRDGAACKTKWNQLIPDYKRIADYLGRTGRNIPEYWELSSAERKAEGLPQVFAQDVYDAIHEWYGNRPQIQPPHVRDMLAPNDSNYRPLQRNQEQEDDAESEPETEDPTEMPLPAAGEDTQDSTPPRSPRITSSIPSHGPPPGESTGTPNSRPFNGVPAGITPHVISSSETSCFAIKRRQGNTGVRRKSISGHSVIAEATKATGAVMAQQMQDIAESSRDLERSKIEVQLKIFSEQMAYQREKDRRLYDNAVVANDNARMAIIKQGEMVSCLAHLSNVLSQSLTMTSSHGFSTKHPAAAKDVNTTATDLHTSAPNFETTAPSSYSTDLLGQLKEGSGPNTIATVTAVGHTASTTTSTSLGPNGSTGPASTD